MNLSKLRKPHVSFNRYHIAGLVTGLLIIAALILPSTAGGVSASLSITGSPYKVGATVPMPASINVGTGEFTKLNSATLNITPIMGGLQAISQSLPTTPGTTTVFDNAVSGKLDVTVTNVNLSSADGSGYGYPTAGSGYVGYASGAKMNYAISWRPPVMLSPAPTVPPNLPATETLFPVPSASGFYTPILDMAFDGTYIYLLGSPNFVSIPPEQRILVLNPNAPGDKFVEVFSAGSQNLDGLVAVGSYLYTFNNFDKKLVRIDKASPHTIVPFDAPFISFNVGGLTYDGASLVAGAKDFNSFQRLTTAGGLVGSSFSAPCYGGCPNGVEDMAFISGSNTLVLAKYNTVYRWSNWSPGPGNLTPDNVNSPFTNFGGIEVSGTTFLMVGSYSSVYRSTIPGSPPPETTSAGDYSAQVTFSTATAGAITSSAQNFTLEKASAVGLAITSPTDNQAFATASITVSGTVVDMSVSTVNVGVVLPLATVFTSGAEGTGEGKWQASGLWHISDLSSPALKNKPPQNLPTPKGGTKVWWYGQESTGDFFTGNSTMGDLDIIKYGASGTCQTTTCSNITVTTGTALSFWTWWETEPGSYYDKKLVQFVPQSGGTENIAQIVDPGMPTFGQSCGSKCTWVFVTPGPFAAFGGIYGGPPPAGAGWQQVTVNLDQFNNSTGKIRFKFDSVDSIANNGKGWFIDDVSISGKSFQGTAATVNPNGTWSTTFSLAQGSNPITATADSAYLPTGAGQPGSESATVTALLDTVAPVVTLNPVTSPTGTTSQTVSGTVQTASFDLLSVTNNGSTVLTSKATPTGGAFSGSIPLVPGTNSIVATITNKAGISGSASATIVLDQTGPTITVNSTRYPVGQVSARASDQVILDVTAADTGGSGVSAVKLVTTAPGGGSQLITFLTSSQVPEAVRNQWGTSGNFILPLGVPSAAASGTLSYTIQAFDNAGNMTESTVSATVVASLQAYNIYLLPDWNLISLPLTPDSTAYAPGTGQYQVQKLTENVSGLVSIWYYDASESNAAQRWKSYFPGSAITPSLTEMQPGRGYWVKMDSTAFSYSAPMASGLPSTPQPKKLSYVGTLLQAGANATPPSYAVVSGWNLIGFHSERSKTVSQALRSVSVPTAIWGSLLAYDNFIRFIKDQPPQVTLGAFSGLDESSSMEPGRGYWIYMQQAGNIVPTN